MTRPPRAALLAGLGLCALLFAAALRFAGRPDRAGEAQPVGREALASQSFPRVAADHHGNTVRIPRPPESIASQSLITDHFLFEVVPAERVVAVSVAARDRRFSFVADVVGRLDVAVSSNPEAVLQRRPDLMLVAHSARADFVDVMQSAGTPVFRLNTDFKDFGQIEEGLRTVGYLCGEDAAAERAIRRLRERLAAARGRRPAGGEPPRVLVYSNFAYTFGRGSLMDHILEELGAVNVAAERGVGPYGSISSEEVAAWNPDWIVAAADSGAEAEVRSRLLADVGVTVTAAGRLGQIVVLANRTYLSMCHHAAGLMEAIAAALYPEAL